MLCGTLRSCRQSTHEEGLNRLNDKGYLPGGVRDDALFVFKGSGESLSSSPLARSKPTVLGRSSATVTVSP
jgi:hypothetical protein